MQITEIFPKTAKLADKFSLVRSVYHTATAVHDTGHQMMQTGRLFAGGVEHPHIGCVLGYLKGGRGELPAHVLLPKPIGRTGGNLPHGQIGRLPRQAARPASSSTPTRRPRTSRCRTCCRRTTSPASRAERRQKLRDAVDGGAAAFETTRPRPSRWTTTSSSPTS